MGPPSPVPWAPAQRLFLCQCPIQAPPRHSPPSFLPYARSSLLPLRVTGIRIDLGDSRAPLTSKLQGNPPGVSAEVPEENMNWAKVRAYQF